MTQRAIDRMIPHSVDAEEALLGSLLIDPMAVLKVRDLVDAGDFYIIKNGWIYDAILSQSNQESTDILTVGDTLKASGQYEEAGGTAYLSSLLVAVPSSVHVRQYAQIVRERAIRRQLIRAAEDVAKAAYDQDTDIEEVQASSEASVMAARRDQRGDVSEIYELACAFSDDIEEYRKNKTGMRGIPSGIEALDNAMGGIVPGIHLIAARPSMGKTALLCQIASNMAAQGRRTVIFTIEMSAAQLTERVATSAAGVELQALMRNQLKDEDYARLIGHLGPVSEWPMTVIDKAPLRPGDILSKVRELQIKHKDIEAVFVDGLWLMTSTKSQRERREQVGSISRELKQIQRHLGMPILITHQLNRGCESRQDKRPLLSDLRETGDCEQDADVVLMIYREGYYDPEAADAKVGEIICRKNRLGGAAGWCAKTYWHGEHMRFEPLTRAGDM